MDNVHEGNEYLRRPSILSPLSRKCHESKAAEVFKKSSMMIEPQVILRPDQLSTIVSRLSYYQHPMVSTWRI